MEIRTGRWDDLDAAVDLWAREGGPTSRPCGRAEAEALLRRDPDALLVALDDGALLGTLILGWDGWRCHLYRLVVEQHARRRRVASQLLTEAKRRAAAFGAGKIDAIVVIENHGAVAFWEHEEFARDRRDGRWSFVL